MVSLFAELFEGDIFARVLLLLLEERMQDAQGLFIYSLVAVFLALVELVDGQPCAYLSGDHYTLTFKELCLQLPNPLDFFLRIKDWQKKAALECCSPEFTELASEMTEFYLSNAYSGDFGEIARQIYQEFLCYHYKNELDLRKIFIIIDKI
jgi:hypothetical protein